jgi:acyl transferase domain-containing protein/3-hydroxymyristoyl/3-hydroxydecanoyl-(acyl carrier protein) dehydratase
MQSTYRQKFGKIAVVGMSGVFPEAFGTAAFIDNILNKKNAVGMVPDHRWNGSTDAFISDRPCEDKAISKKAGLIRGFQFDPSGFSMDPALLSLLDPVHQLVLHAGREALLQCVHTPELTDKTGVILAAIALPTQASVDFSSQVLLSNPRYAPVPADFSRTSVVSFPAAVLARALGLKAGCFTLDAACASSLVAIKLACEHLQLKKADMMLAGGVSRPSSVYTQIGFSQLQALSPTGTCAPFDQRANGLVVGEGSGIVVLKRLEDAIANGDTIHAVISGAGVSNDIDGTLVGPASEGQQRAMQKAYYLANWSIDDIQYMECHGSGTPVGDQVELTSIMALLDQFNCTDKHLKIGSVKSNIGHLLTAAGAAGFIKTILAMNKTVLPPSLNFTAPPEKSILNQSNIMVQTVCEDWKPKNSNTTRKAGVSAFGFGGINAHLLIEEYQPASFHAMAATVEPHTGADTTLSTVPCAIVGMATITKGCSTLDDFEDLIFGNTRLSPDVPADRWRRPAFENESIDGLYMNDLVIRIGEFHIPPNQIDDILTQHLILLKATKRAILDAGLTPRPESDTSQRDHMGCAIGIDFDYGAADFNLRWQFNHLDKDITDHISPPLTFNRTLGALGGIVASRVAREFKLGGPCFTVSADMASGLKTIETAVHSLSAKETTLFVCGCVDLAGDIRQVLRHTHAMPRSNTIFPSEGAAAIVIKRLDQAIADKDNIYAVIAGSGAASGNPLPGETASYDAASTHEISLNNALSNSGVSFKQIHLYEAALSGVTAIDTAEKQILKKQCRASGLTDTAFLTATTPVIGNTYASASLFSVIKTALCLYHDRYPAWMATCDSFFDTRPIPFEQGTQAGLKTACVASASLDGACAHLILKPHLSRISPLRRPAMKDKTDATVRQMTVKTNPRILSAHLLEMLSNRQNRSRSDHFTDDDARQGQDVLSTVNRSEPDFNQDKASPWFNPELIVQGTEATARAHNRFLQFSQTSMQHMTAQLETLTRIAKQALPDDIHQPELSDENTLDRFFDHSPASDRQNVFLNREQCLEYATGNAGNVLGPAFDIIDTYPVRVRLPAEPLMLVDRIICVEGEMLSLSAGKVVTQHDVKPEAWYLDGGKTPVSISIEAGQADLFLCAWLGIDHVVKGTRKYRLLDAKVTFHRTLPEPGETIEYHIEIDRFLKQGDVYLFFFHYKGYINNQLLISMRDGCAGFFTEQEVDNSGGIILKKEDRFTSIPDQPFQPMVPVKKEQFSDRQVNALRVGDLETAFGQAFSSITLGKNMLLPSGRMHLIDRVLEFDPSGGRFGMGRIVAQADIHPDDWFLTCHFIDDMVMPGTLMYECCAHALRVFTQRMGWVSPNDDVYYDVLTHNESDLKCRGPVTCQTRHARYEIEIKKMGFNPEPYVIADAHMFSDDLQIVLYKDMGMKIINLSQAELESFWRQR